MKILVIKPTHSFPFLMNSSNSPWSLKLLCECSCQYSGLSLFTSSSIINDLLFPQHIMHFSDSMPRSDFRIYHHKILTNVKILKAHIQLCTTVPYPSSLLKHFCLNVFEHIMTSTLFMPSTYYYLSTTSCHHFPFYPG